MAVSAQTMAAKRVEPKSTHVSESNLQPFLQQEFDPADYLNNALPSLSTSSNTRSRAVPLPELSTQLQTLLSQLNAQTSRLSNTLTQLTDEIVRSGGRLAYEVEVLRGETIGLSNSLENGLKKDIEIFTPAKSVPQNGIASEEVAQDKSAEDPTTNHPNEPDYLTRLRTLTAVRTKLDSVIQVFGQAMQWPLAPSELFLTSSLISVSAPEPSSEDARSREEKGKAHAEKLRNEINDLVGSGNDITGLEAAAARIEELRQLAEVWKGTAEEKARMKFIESLQKPIEERHKALEKTSRPTASPSKGVDYRYGNLESRAVGEGGYGFLQNLRNLKNDMYLE